VLIYAHRHQRPKHINALIAATGIEIVFGLISLAMLRPRGGVSGCPAPADKPART